jgi:hypothetical protein
MKYYYCLALVIIHEIMLAEAIWQAKRRRRQLRKYQRMMVKESVK